MWIQLQLLRRRVTKRREGEYGTEVPVPSVLGGAGRHRVFIDRRKNPIIPNRARVLVSLLRDAAYLKF